MLPNVHSSVIYNSQVLETNAHQQMSGSKTVVNLHSGILHSRKKVLLLFTTAWMELESILLSEISQAVKDKYHMISPVINKSTKQTSKQNRTRDMEIKNKLTVTRGEGGGE